MVYNFLFLFYFLPFILQKKLPISSLLPSPPICPFLSHSSRQLQQQISRPCLVTVWHASSLLTYFPPISKPFNPLHIYTLPALWLSNASLFKISIFNLIPKIFYNFHVTPCLDVIFHFCITLPCFSCSYTLSEFKFKLRQLAKAWLKKPWMKCKISLNFIF